MSRYWIIAPLQSEPRELFDKVWKFDLDNNLVSIGWKELGDVSSMSRQQLLEAVASTYRKRPPQTKTLFSNMLWAFYHEIGPGDFIIARRGRKTLASVGRVTRLALYAVGRNPFCDHPNFLGVAWENPPREKSFAGIVFPMHTLSESSEEQFQTLLGGSTVQGIVPENREEIEDPSAFVLEKYLEEFIVSNFQTIFRRDLTIYKDEEGNEGQQYATEVGPIDILAFESSSKSFVIIELKKGRPSDQVMGQILRYMGWVKANLCRNNEGVKGLIICREPDPKLSYALQMTKGIDVKYYNVSFKLADTPPTS